MSLKRTFGIVETNLDNILVSFRQTLSDLDAHVSYHLGEAQRHATEASKHEFDRAQAVAAATKADAIRGNIAKLIGD